MYNLESILIDSCAVCQDICDGKIDDTVNQGINCFVNSSQLESRGDQISNLLTSFKRH